MGETLTDERGKTHTMSREDYKAIKHMNKAELSAYMARVWIRGYRKGNEDGQAGKDAFEPKK